MKKPERKYLTAVDAEQSRVLLPSWLGTILLTPFLHCAERQNRHRAEQFQQARAARRREAYRAPAWALDRFSGCGN